MKERAGKGVWLAIIIGFTGVLIAVNVNAYDATAWPGAAIACMLVGNLAAAVYALTIKWGGKSESTTALIVYPELVVFVLCVGFLTLTQDWPRDALGIFYVALAGLSNGFANLLYTRAYRVSHKNALIAPLHYTQIIFGSIAGYVIWHDVPTPNLLVGVVVIIAAGLYVVWHGAGQAETDTSNFEAAT